LFQLPPKGKHAGMPRPLRSRLRCTAGAADPGRVDLVTALVRPALPWLTHHRDGELAGAAPLPLRWRHSGRRVPDAYERIPRWARDGMPLRQEGLVMSGDTRAQATTRIEQLDPALEKIVSSSEP